MASPVILLTGGTGFFGRRLLENLSDRGYQVAAPHRPGFDLMDRASVERTVREVAPGIVVHSAAYYGGLGITMREPAEIFFRNVQMSINIIDAAARFGVKRIVAVGSACGYAGDVAGDMREEDYWSGPLHPSVEAYGFTKKVQQVGINAYARQFGVKGQFPLLTNLYGEDDVYTEYRSHVIAAFIKRFADAALEHKPEVVCWGTGRAVREFIYSRDAAEAVARLLEKEYFEPLNVGTGVGTSIRELAEITARHAGYRGKIVWDSTKSDGVMRKVLDVTRMKKVLGWEPPTTLDAGMARTMKWYLAHKEEADARQ
jgi:GDP-L-fucose synthase